MTDWYEESQVCKHCGADLNKGILANIDHWNDCPPFRLDADKQAEEYDRKIRKAQQEEEKAFAPIFKRMTKEERDELMRYTFAGLITYGNNGDATVMMGSEGIQRLYDFKQKMKEKYEQV